VSWDCDLTEDAKRDLGKLPLEIKRRVSRVLDQMALGPFVGDVKALQGAAFRGVFRRRIGSYRVLFVPNEKEMTFTVIRILPRSKGTYR
jgi:mRNA-degrading endonuclease RelE of RelBE toxin-antitoxin system